jgi:xanthine dehydrogenase accessory factor
MKEIFEEIIRLAAKDEPFVLSTVVQTKGSTPQKAGAKLLIRKDGTAIGTLGGGCVEGDMWHLGKQLLKEKGKPLYREYELNEEVTERGGLVCGGTMWFFIEPIFSPQIFQLYAGKILRAYQEGPATALVIVVRDANQDLETGNKMLVFEDGTFEGNFTDQHLAFEVLKMAGKIAAVGGRRVFKTKSNAEIYIEGFTASPSLILMGG